MCGRCAGSSQQVVAATVLLVLVAQTLPDGSNDPARLTPRTAGFGAATGAQPMRNLQVQVRFMF